MYIVYPYIDPCSCWTRESRAWKPFVCLRSSGSNTLCPAALKWIITRTRSWIRRRPLIYIIFERIQCCSRVGSLHLLVDFRFCTLCFGDECFFDRSVENFNDENIATSSCWFSVQRSQKSDTTRWRRGVH